MSQGDLITYNRDILWDYLVKGVALNDNHYCMLPSLSAGIIPTSGVDLCELVHIITFSLLALELC